MPETLNLNAEPVTGETESTGSSNTLSGLATGGAVAADVVGRIIWAVVGVLAVFSLLTFFYSRYTAYEISAIQICQLAAEALTLAVIPYIVARAWDEIFRRGRWHRNP